MPVQLLVIDIAIAVCTLLLLVRPGINPSPPPSSPDAESHHGGWIAASALASALLLPSLSMALPSAVCGILMLQRLRLPLVTGGAEAAPLLALLAALSFAPGAWTLSLVYAGGGLNSPGGIAIDGEGNLWAADNLLVGSQSTVWNTLGVARYRAGDWKGAVEALNKSREVRNGGLIRDFFFLSMACWKLGAKDEARKWYTAALAWTEKRAPKDE